jgi:hypothetical protein
LPREMCLPRNPQDDPVLMEAGELAERLHMNRKSVVVNWRRFAIKPHLVTETKGIYWDRKRVEQWIADGAKDKFGRRRVG